MMTPLTSQRRIIVTALTAALAPVGLLSEAQATAVQWNSQLQGVTNLDSTGTPLDGSFSFHLGAFSHPSVPAGWAPDATNTGEWHQYWVTADVSPYVPSASVFSGRFSSRHGVNGTIAAGSPAFIWGTNRDHPNAEWILLTDPDWVWPSDNPLDFTTVSFTIDENTSAVVGQVNTTGVQMQTAVVSGGLPPLLSGELWQEIHFTPDEIAHEESTVSGWNADPNGNGRPNILEFAYGTDPRTAQLDGQPVPGVTDVSESRFLTMTVTRNPNILLDFSAEVTGDLQTWFSGGAHVVLESESATELIYRDLTPIGPGAPSRAMRLRVNWLP
jgi:hypothetical protein